MAQTAGSAGQVHPSGQGAGCGGQQNCWAAGALQSREAETLRFRGLDHFWPAAWAPET